ncbi:MAG TPA: twin-arginine translocase TatA/TatE family subunit, partial [Actinomycetota bacterium]|nr:twin-arginine translocase TatA/TatE family subunit [Actinomycetota bacterium]
MELLVILVLALIVVGPAKLPEVGRTIGRALREFRKAQDEVRQTLTFDLEEPEPPRRPVRSSARPAATAPPPPAPSEEVAADHPVEDRLRAA